MRLCCHPIATIAKHCPRLNIILEHVARNTFCENSRLDSPPIHSGPLGACGANSAGRVAHLFTGDGYDGADKDAEKLRLAGNENLFRAISLEADVVLSGQPVAIVGDFTIEPTKVPCMAKGMVNDTWEKSAQTSSVGLLPSPTCKASLALIRATSALCFERQMVFFASGGLILV